MENKIQLCGFSFTRDIDANPKKVKIQTIVLDYDNPEEDKGPELNYHEVGTALGFHNITHKDAGEIWAKFTAMSFEENLKTLSKITNIPNI